MQYIPLYYLLCVAVSNVPGASTLVGAIAAGCVLALLLLGALVTLCYCGQRRQKINGSHILRVNNNEFVLR